MKILEKLSRRMFCSILVFAAISGALDRSISYAQPYDQSSIDRVTESEEQLFQTFSNKLHGTAVNSIGIDYTPEARCSDNNWSTLTPVACNPQLSFQCTENNPLSTC